MAELPDEITTIVLDLQRRLLRIIDRATATGFAIVDRHGETEATLTVLDQLQNVRERAETYNSRFYTLLLRIAQSYPNASPAMLEMLVLSIEEAGAIAPAAEATIQEAKRDWYIS